MSCISGSGLLKLDSFEILTEPIPSSSRASRLVYTYTANHTHTPSNLVPHHFCTYVCQIVAPPKITLFSSIIIISRVKGAYIYIYIYQFINMWV
ncbi:hypothetical protein Hanom_Chr13g01230041 [Helianthus anomalus]